MAYYQAMEHKRTHKFTGFLSADTRSRLVLMIADYKRNTEYTPFGNMFKASIESGRPATVKKGDE